MNQLFSPFCISSGFGKYIISSIKIHNAILEMKFPFVFTSVYLIILAHNIFCIKEFLSFLITHIIFTIEGFLKMKKESSFIYISCITKKRSF